MAQKQPRKALPATIRTSPTSPSTPTGPSTSIAQDTEDTTAHNDGDLPPSYTGPILAPCRTVTTSLSGPLAHVIPVDFSLYRIPGASISKDRTTITVTDPIHTSNALTLLNLIQSHSKLPPHPQIRITGEDFSQPFDIRISMMRYIVRQPDSTGSSNWNYIKVISDGELAWRGEKEQSRSPRAPAGLKSWIHMFVEDDIKSKKSFTLTKQVTNWNTAFLEGQIRNLIASANYTGTVKVTFPITHSKLVFQPKLNRQWHEKIAAVFQSSQVKRYEVVTAVWPYAALSPDDARGQGNDWAVQSEMQFWSEWKDVIHSAILQKRSGWLSLEDHIEWAMGDGWAVREADWQ